MLTPPENWRGWADASRDISGGTRAVVVVADGGIVPSIAKRGLPFTFKLIFNLVV